MYGKVSRYRLDEYLQLFDFPSPNLTSEKRHITNVPLQRLFFMNSDFVQQQAELLAQRVASEADQAARIRKAYRLVFGRAPTDAELQAGLEFLKTEPLRAYEERKTAKEKKKDEPAEAKAPPDAEQPEAIAADAMMAGVVPGEAKKADEKLLRVTAWGRYAKVVLSSAEFLFVN